MVQSVFSGKMQIPVLFKQAILWDRWYFDSEYPLKYFGRLERKNWLYVGMEKLLSVHSHLYWSTLQNTSAFWIWCYTIKYKISTWEMCLYMPSLILRSPNQSENLKPCFVIEFTWLILIVRCTINLTIWTLNRLAHT